MARKKKAEAVEAPAEIVVPKMDTFLRQRTNPDIHIVGAGGIGGNLIYHLFRDRAVIGNKIGHIYLYDGDTVEEKNILRQNFLEKEVGRNKADALSARYADYLRIKAMPVFFDPSFKINDNMKNIDTISANSIIICCVDNLRTRLDILGELQDIYQELGAKEVPLFIDCGNETFHGNTIYCHNNRVLWDYYKYLDSRKSAKSDAPYHKNCADYQPEEAGFVQIYHVNNLAAIYASMFLNKVLKGTDNWEMLSKLQPDGHMFTMNGTRSLKSSEDFKVEEPKISTDLKLEVPLEVTNEQ